MTGTIVDVSPQEQIEVDPLSLPVVYNELDADVSAIFAVEYHTSI